MTFGTAAVIFLLVAAGLIVVARHRELPRALRTGLLILLPVIAAAALVYLAATLILIYGIS